MNFGGHNEGVSFHWLPNMWGTEEWEEVAAVFSLVSLEFKNISVIIRVFSHMRLINERKNIVTSVNSIFLILFIQTNAYYFS